VIATPYKNPEEQAEFMRRWRARKRVEAKNLEADYHRLYHENLALKKMLKEKKK